MHDLRHHLNRTIATSESKYPYIDLGHWEKLGSGSDGEAFKSPDGTHVCKCFFHKYEARHLECFVLIIQKLNADRAKRADLDGISFPDFNIVSSSKGLSLLLPFIDGTAVGRIDDPPTTSIQRRSLDAIRYVKESMSAYLGYEIADIGQVRVSSGEINVLNILKIEDASSGELIYFDPIPMSAVASFVDHPEGADMARTVLSECVDSQLKDYLLSHALRDGRFNWYELVADSKVSRDLPLDVVCFLLKSSFNTVKYDIASVQRSSSSHVPLDKEVRLPSWCKIFRKNKAEKVYEIAATLGSYVTDAKIPIIIVSPVGELVGESGYRVHDDREKDFEVACQVIAATLLGRKSIEL